MNAHETFSFPEVDWGLFPILVEKHVQLPKSNLIIILFLWWSCFPFFFLLSSCKICRNGFWCLYLVSLMVSFSFFFWERKETLLLLLWLQLLRMNEWLKGDLKTLKREATNEGNATRKIAERKRRGKKNSLEGYFSSWLDSKWITFITEQLKEKERKQLEEETRVGNNLSHTLFFSFFFFFFFFLPFLLMIQSSFHDTWRPSSVNS